MTLGEMKAYGAQLVDDILFGYFTSATWDAFLNQSAKECQKKLVAAGNNWYLTVDTSQTLVNGTGTYTLPTNTLEVNRIEIVQNPGVNETWYTLQDITLNQQSMVKANSSISGQPAAFYLQKNSLVMWPQPDASVAGRTLRIWYSPLIADVTVDANTFDIPATFHEYVVLLATVKCFLKDGRDPQFILNQMKDTEYRLEKAAIERTKTAASRVVTVTDGIHGDGFMW